MKTNLQTKRSLTQSFSRPIVNLLRAGRHLTYLSLGPFDFLSRMVNGKADFPPLHLRRYVGPLRTFEASGAEFMSYLRLLADMRPSDRILDVGCGCGLMALYLKDYLNEMGSYAGVDLHHPSIKWCASHLGSQYRNLKFAHINVKSLAYNPTGEDEAENFKFPYESGSFDIILLKSVFTHMRPSEIEGYLIEVARLLKDDGRCLATFFLLNDTQKHLAVDDRNALKFDYGDEQWRYVYEHSPESASAYDQGYILDLLARHDLGLEKPIIYGHWSGRDDGLSFQDMLVIKKIRSAHS